MTVATKKDFSFGIVPVRYDTSEPQFLLIQHKNADHWSFPKGHKENQESDLEAAMRELEEETGIKNYKVNENATFAEEYIYTLGTTLIQKKVIFYLATVSNPQVTPQEKEIKDFRWVSYKDALELMTFKAGKQVLKAAWRYLKNYEATNDSL